jgi:hypothetical protein
MVMITGCCTTAHPPYAFVSARLNLADRTSRLATALQSPQKVWLPITTSPVNDNPPPPTTQPAPMRHLCGNSSEFAPAKPAPCLPQFVGTLMSAVS